MSFNQSISSSAYSFQDTIIYGTIIASVFSLIFTLCKTEKDHRKPPSKSRQEQKDKWLNIDSETRKVSLGGSNDEPFLASNESVTCRTQQPDSSGPTALMAGTMTVKTEQIPTDDENRSERTSPERHKHGSAEQTPATCPSHVGPLSKKSSSVARAHVSPTTVASTQPASQDSTKKSSLKKRNSKKTIRERNSGRGKQSSRRGKQQDYVHNKVKASKRRSGRKLNKPTVTASNTHDNTQDDVQEHERVSSSRRQQQPSSEPEQLGVQNHHNRESPHRAAGATSSPHAGVPPTEHNSLYRTVVPTQPINTYGGAFAVGPGRTEATTMDEKNSLYRTVKRV